MRLCKLCRNDVDSFIDDKILEGYNLDPSATIDLVTVPANRCEFWAHKVARDIADVLKDVNEREAKA